MLRRVSTAASLTPSLPLSVEHAAQKRLDGLNLDERDFPPAIARLFRVKPGPEKYRSPSSPRPRHARASAIDCIGADSSGAMWTETTFPSHIRRSYHAPQRVRRGAAGRHCFGGPRS
jgi:hypothetical protein